MSRQLGIEFKRSKYRILGLVGQGQFGRVFCAVQRQTGQLVALKELEQRRFPTHKFLRELRFLLSLQHPNIVTCQALEHTSTGRYLVMDYCEGGTLRSLMSEENHLSLPHSIKLVADILAGLEHAHSRDIVHCDIKPENILLSVEPAGWIARISDFGVARLSQEMSSQEFGNTGSPAYMAPERFYGQYSQTSDLYAVGILLFELITGQRPFSGTPANLMSAHLNQPVKIPSTVPEIWHPLILTALQKLSARRFRTAGEMLAMLRSIATDQESGIGLGALPLPLFRSTVTLPASPFLSQQQQAGEQPITSLAVSSPQFAANFPSHLSAAFYSATIDRVTCYGCQHRNTSQLSEVAQTHEVCYSNPIESLFPCPKGCFVITRRSIHLISLAEALPANPISCPILQLNQDYRAAIDKRGRWIATLTIDTGVKEETPSLLKIWQLAGSTLTGTSRSIAITLEQRSVATVRLITLDTHHFAVVLDRVSPVEKEQNHARLASSSLIKVFTRRGTQAGILHLPIRIEQLTPTLEPYQFLSIDCTNPCSVVLIDLKPYRILRLSVGIKPKFLLSTAWGYIIANSREIICLDREARSVGQLLAPASITAMTAIEPSKLLLATWNGLHSNLHILNLQESGLELLF